MTDYRLPLFDDGMDDPDEPQPSMLSRGLDPGDAPLPSRRSPSLLAQRLTPPEPPAVVGTPSDALAAPQPLGGPGKLSSDLDAITEALGRGPALREVPDKPVVVKVTEPIPVAVVNLPGAIPTAAAPTVITPSFGLGPGRPSVADAGATPALPTKVEVLDEAGLAQLVKSVGQQTADIMVKQDRVRLRRTAPVEGASEGSAETPYAMPEMEIAPPPAARAYQPPSEAALPAEHALEDAEVVPEKPPKITPWVSPLTKAARVVGAAGMPNAAAMSAGIGELAEGGAEGLAGAAMPVLGIAQAAGNMAAGVFRSEAATVQAAGAATVSAIGNDPMGAFNKAVDGASSALEKIPIVGQAAAAGLQLVVAPVRAFTDVVQAFVDRGKELAQYLGALSATQAKVTVRDLMADIREAQELGPGMAKVTDEQDRIWNDIRDMMIPIKKLLLDILGPILEQLRKFLEWIEPQVLWQIEFLKAFPELMADALKNDQDDIKRVLIAINKNVEKEMAGDAKDVLDMLYAVMGGRPDANQQQPPANPFGGQPQPLFPGQ